jgi:hypothetical protein
MGLAVVLQYKPTTALQSLPDGKIGWTLSSLPPLSRSTTLSTHPESLRNRGLWVTPRGSSGVATFRNPLFEAFTPLPELLWMELR